MPPAKYVIPKCLFSIKTNCRRHYTFFGLLNNIIVSYKIFIKTIRTNKYITILYDFCLNLLNQTKTCSKTICGLNGERVNLVPVSTPPLQRQFFLDFFSKMNFFQLFIVRSTFPLVIALELSHRVDTGAELTPTSIRDNEDSGRTNSWV